MNNGRIEDHLRRITSALERSHRHAVKGWWESVSHEMSNALSWSAALDEIMRESFVISKYSMNQGGPWFTVKMLNQYLNDIHLAATRGNLTTTAEGIENAQARVSVLTHLLTVSDFIRFPQGAPR